VVEYGGGIDNGPAGQVGGGGNTVAGGGGAPAAQQPDIFDSISNSVGNVIDQVAGLPTETLVLGIVIFFLGLIVLKRAF
jgi:hypothetical protein